MNIAKKIEAGVFALAKPIANAFWPDPRKSIPKAEQTGFNKPGAYFENNFAPVTEEVTLTELNVKGTIPEELTGRYLRSGPNPFGEYDPLNDHWFRAEGMIHGIRLANGKADWYRNRWVRTAEMAETLGEDVAGRNLPFSPNIHIFPHAGKTWSLVESTMAPVEIGYELDTIGQPAGWGTFTGHPKIDPDTGEMHGICYNPQKYPKKIKYVVVDKAGILKKIVEVPMPASVMIHDMAITKNYVIIFDLPIRFSFKQLFKGHKIPFEWSDEHEPRVGLLPRDGEAKDIIWCEVDPCFVFHPMNAYEDDDGSVVLDVFRLDYAFKNDIYGPMGDSLPKMFRWTVNPKTCRVSEVLIDERTREFPDFHRDLEGKPYRFGYSLAAQENVSFPGFYKNDVVSGESWYHDFGAGRHGAEPTFVPKKGATNEDEGYLIAYIYDGNRNASELMIIDAQDFTAPPLAVIELPVRVPFGFHGSWVPDSLILTS